MTAVSPRMPLERLRGIGNPFARVGRSVVARLERREQLPRPPAYVVLCATVTVLNVVGLVMILSASSVAALSDYGSSWYFFDRQLMWAVVGLAAFLVASRIDYRRWRRFAPFLLVFAFGHALARPRRRQARLGFAALARARPAAAATERDREARAPRLRRRDPDPSAPTGSTTRAPGGRWSRSSSCSPRS